MQNDYILHLDMDGVITDFDTAFEAISGGVTSEEYKKQGKSPSKLYLSHGAKFWENLNWERGGQEVLNFALTHFKVVRILSSAGTGKDWAKYKEVQSGKTAWLAKYAPQIEKKNIIIVPFHTLKARHAGSDRILVDDHDVNINGWVKAGGVGVLHASENWQASLSTLRHYTSVSGKPREKVAAI